MNKFVAGIPFTKVDSQKHIIAGYASVEVVDRDSEIVKREALDKALSEYMRNPIIRWMHKEEPIGKVLNAYVDEKGLYVEAYITDKTPEGKKAWSLIEDGIVKAFSIGGSVNNKEYTVTKDGKHVGVITDLALREISVVDIPANPESFFEVISKIANGGDSMEDDWFCKKAKISTGAWNPPKTIEERRKLKEKCGSKAFLMPEELKFPVMDSACNYNINGVRAALHRAAQHGHTQIEAKARRLLQRLKEELGRKGVIIDDLEKDIRGDNMAEEVKKEDEQPKAEVQEEQKVQEVQEQSAEKPAEPAEAPAEEKKEASEEVGELSGNGVQELVNLAKRDVKTEKKAESSVDTLKIDEATIEKIVDLIEKKLDEKKSVVVETKKEDTISGGEALLELAKKA